MHTLDDILSDSGPIARLLGADFEARPQQQHMARAVVVAGVRIAPDFATVLVISTAS